MSRRETDARNHCNTLAGAVKKYASEQRDVDSLAKFVSEAVDASV